MCGPRYRWLIVVGLAVLFLQRPALAQGQSSPGTEPAPVQQPAPANPTTIQPAASMPETEKYELPNDPTIPKKFESPAALEKWLDEIEKLYVPPKWSEQPKLSNEARKELEAQRKNALNKVNQARNADEFQTQIAVVLQLDRQLHGTDSEVVLKTLQEAANVYESNGAWQFAITTQQELSTLATRVCGPQSYQEQHAQLALAHLELLQKLTAVQRQQLQAAGEANQQVLALLGQGKYATAIPLSQTVIETREKLLGPNHPDTATSLSNLAGSYFNMGEYAQAVTLSTRSLKITEKAFGPDHPSTALSLNNLAVLYDKVGDYARAIPLSTRALKITVITLGPEHSYTAANLNNLAGLYDSMGDYTRAEPLYSRALKIREKTVGPDHPDTALSVSNLAQLYNNMGDYARAVPLSTRALNIKEKALGSDHPDTAKSLNNLAELYRKMSDYTQAEPLYIRALEIYEKTLGPDHPDTATSLGNLAVLHNRLGAYTRAEPLYIRALKIYEKTLGPDHPDTATSLNNLAELYRIMGDFARAEPLYTRALKIHEKGLGPNHPYTATSLHNLAVLYKDSGDYTRAEPLYTRALKITETALGPDHPHMATSFENLGLLNLIQQQPRTAIPQFERAFQIRLKQFQSTTAIQSERQQQEFAANFRIDGYLQALLEAQVPVTEHYARILLRKGLVFRRQQALRAIRDNPQLQPIFSDWQRTLTQLSQAALKTPANEAERTTLQTRVHELTTHKEQLETQLAKESQEFAATQKFTTLAEVQSVLPKNGILIDCYEYAHQNSPNAANKTIQAWERRLVALIIPPQGEIKLLDLGLAQPVQQQLAIWLGPERSDLGNSKEAQAAGQKLRQQLWEPLAKYLPSTAAGEVPLVLLSPDGVLNQVPWNALPGAKPGTYLLDETALTILPVPQLLPRLLKPLPRPENKQQPQDLLILGNVAYDQRAKAPTPTPAPAFTPVAGNWIIKRGAESEQYSALPGTAAELATLSKLFQAAYPKQQLTSLEQAAASKAAFRQAAEQHRLLHLATHGFFAPKKYQLLLAKQREARPDTLGSQQQQASINPNLLSGLVFAGVNLPAQDQDDGILTAEEVLGLDLRDVELATLSACETGLGTAASGEGLLGLQRAFQVAGCQTTVTSLWKVSDEGTTKLMEKFYENLWGKKLPRLEALRQAQLWMLREGPKHGFGAGRGLGRINNGPAATQASPFFWAPFVLSGDWR